MIQETNAVYKCLKPDIFHKKISFTSDRAGTDEEAEQNEHLT